MDKDQVLRAHLLDLLHGRNAHMTFDQAVADFPMEAINRRAPNVPYSPWQLLEHLRIAQWDILEFIRNPEHVSPDWPAGYWPPQEAQAGESEWRQTVESFRSDQAALRELVADPEADFLSDLPHASGYSILREILVVSDHNAYHIGEFGALRQVLGAWQQEAQA